MEKEQIVVVPIPPHGFRIIVNGSSHEYSDIGDVCLDLAQRIIKDSAALLASTNRELHWLRTSLEPLTRGWEWEMLPSGERGWKWTGYMRDDELRSFLGTAVSGSSGDDLPHELFPLALHCDRPGYSDE